MNQLTIIAASTDAATLAAFLASGAALLTAIGGAVVAIYLARSNRRRNDAETALQRAGANRTDVETQFTGTVYIKDLSEAAATLVGASRTENEGLRERIKTLEKERERDSERIDALEEENATLKRELHDARDEMMRNNMRFQDQMRQLMIRYGVPRGLEGPSTTPENS